MEQLFSVYCELLKSPVQFQGTEKLPIYNISFTRLWKKQTNVQIIVIFFFFKVKKGACKKINL